MIVTASEISRFALSGSWMEANGAENRVCWMVMMPFDPPRRIFAPDDFFTFNQATEIEKVEIPHQNPKLENQKINREL